MKLSGPSYLYSSSSALIALELSNLDTAYCSSAAEKDYSLITDLLIRGASKVSFFIYLPFALNSFRSGSFTFAISFPKICSIAPTIGWEEEM